MFVLHLRGLFIFVQKTTCKGISIIPSIFGEPGQHNGQKKPNATRTISGLSAISDSSASSIYPYYDIESFGDRMENLLNIVNVENKTFHPFDNLKDNVFI